MKGLKFNQKLLINTIIADLVVEQSPRFINDFLFKTNPLTGITLTAAGAAVGIAVGLLLKKPDIGTLSLAIAASDILNEMLGTVELNASPVQDFISVGADGKPVFSLADYTNDPQVMPTTDYQKSYNILN